MRTALPLLVALVAAPALAGTVSPEVTKAVQTVQQSEDAAARAAAWKVLGDEEAEVQRMLSRLTGHPSDEREDLWAAFKEYDKKARRLEPKRKRKAMRGLRKKVAPLVAPWVADLLAEQRAACAQHAFRAHAAALEAVRGALPYRAQHAEPRPPKAYDAWVERRDRALAKLLDPSKKVAGKKRVYLAKDGEPRPDRDVEKVRKAWEPVDALLTDSLAPLLKLSPEQVQALFAGVEGAKARLEEVNRVRLAGGENPLQVGTLSAVYGIFLRYWAGEREQAARVAELTPWERVLFDRLREERVFAHNASFVQGKAIERGLLPTYLELEQVHLTNDHRLMFGLPALELDPRLVEAAHGHSADMSRLKFFSHESPVQGKRTFLDRTRLAGYPGGGGENVTKSARTPRLAHLLWVKSLGHHRNILHAEFKSIGVGHVGGYWTQNFGRASTFER